jgi:hypothetical protein
MERHDFRFGRIELEVKTTTTASRAHFINSWDQLLPSPGMSLYVHSIQLEGAGKAPGFSLPDLVGTVRAALGPGLREALAERLQGVGYTDDESRSYGDRYKRRTPDRLVPIDTKCPRLVREIVKLPEPLKQRISELHYRIDLEGLGAGEGSAAFRRVFGKGAQNET